MTVEELPDHLRAHWLHIREEFLAGRYQPQPVKRVAISKPGGGERVLGIPTVLDRFLQQALLQVLQPRLDPTFSDHSYGFGPIAAHTTLCVGRSAMCRKAAALSWTSTWRHSSTG